MTSFDYSQPTFGTFEDRAVWLIEQLVADFPSWGPRSNPNGAYACAGNLGRESNIQMIQEGRTVPGGWPGANVAGGWGLPQWTGPRRRAFADYCSRAKRNPAAMTTGYAYLFVELGEEFASTVTAVAAAPDLASAVAAFETHYEMAGVVAEGDRLAYAVRAQKAWEAHLAAAPAPATTTAPPPSPPAKPAATVPGDKPMTAPAPATAPAGSTSGISLATIKRMLDNVDDEIDAFRDFPIIGNLATSVALILDPVRKAVDGGVIDTVRKSVDQIDDEIGRLSTLPLLGGFIGSIATVTHRLRVYVDAADPASSVAAAPG